MENPSLDETTFQALDDGTSGAFLLVSDAIQTVRDAFSSSGFTADPAKPDERRVVRVVTIPQGTRLFKLTHYPELGKRSPLSPWWSNAEPFAESDMSARTVFETALLNGVDLRAYVRFASAVPLDWNLLDYYVEITVNRDVGAYWGQFAPQSGRMPTGNGGAGPAGTTVSEQASPSGDDGYVHYDTSSDPDSEVYLPATLGGVSAWQFYVPDFSNQWIDAGAVSNISSTDSVRLAAHFGVSADRVAQLDEQSQPVRKDPRALSRTADPTASGSVVQPPAVAAATIRGSAQAAENASMRAPTRRRTRQRTTAR